MGRKRRPINHGTAGGYHTHVTRGVPPCQACKDAKAAYMRQLRQTPEKKAREKLRVKAYDHARRALASNHPEEFERLLTYELTRLEQEAFDAGGD